jgi:hypothetical protein
MTKRIKFTEAEIKALAENPAALKALATWHDLQWCLGDAMGFDCAANLYRVQELVAEANRLEQRYADGNGPGFIE